MNKARFSTTDFKGFPNEAAKLQCSLSDLKFCWRRQLKTDGLDPEWEMEFCKDFSSAFFSKGEPLGRMLTFYKLILGCLPEAANELATECWHFLREFDEFDFLKNGRKQPNPTHAAHV